MLFAVLFEDNPAAGVDVRRRHMQDHLAFLDLHALRIKAAGPLQTDKGEPAGGLWLVEAENEAEVKSLVENDPFWPTGLRQSVQIRRWTRVHADGRRLIS